MASTIIIYEGDGTKTDFTIPFDYLKKSFVTVRLGSGTALTGGDYGDTGSDYYFLDKTTIRLKVAPASGKSLTIRRYTSATERVVTFKDASILKATDLDTSQLQAFHIAEEGRDILEDALSVNREGNWDAKNKRIVNLADPVNPQDALTKAYYDKDSQKVQANRDETEKFMQRAETAADNAKQSEANAKASEESAKESADYVKETAGVVVPIAPEIKVVADNIEDVRTVAGLADDFQTIIDSVETITNLTTRAETAATNAASSATNAKTSETNAKTSETNAKTSEIAASASASSATASATEATAQAERAKDYANQSASGQLQADWSETDTTAKSFIKNKPSITTYNVALAELQEGTNTTFGHVTAAGIRGAIKKWAPVDVDISGKADKTYVDTGLAEMKNTVDSSLATKLDVSVFNAFVDYGDLGEQ